MLAIASGPVSVFTETLALAPLIPGHFGCVLIIRLWLGSRHGQPLFQALSEQAMVSHPHFHAAECFSCLSCAPLSRMLGRHHQKQFKRGAATGILAFLPPHQDPLAANTIGT